MSELDWRYCPHCSEFFWPSRSEQRYCGGLCASLSRHRPPVEKSQELDRLEVIAEACAKFIVSGHRPQGVTAKELAEYIEGYASLCETDRFRVNVLTCTRLGVAYDADDGLFRFWSKARQQQGEAVARAARFA